MTSAGHMEQSAGNGLRLPLTLCLVLGAGVTPVMATDHFNLEGGIPTALEDIEPLERGSVELQGFGRYLRLREGANGGEAEPRLAWGVCEKTQLEIATPLLAGEGASRGNGDLRIGVLRKLFDDRTGARAPGVAVAADVRLPTGVEQQGFTNRVDAGLTVILKKDVGPHSFHLNAGFDWTGDTTADEPLRRLVLNIILGHDTRLTDRLVLVSDVVWHPADETHMKDVWLAETGARAQMARSVVGAIGVSVGLKSGEDTPLFSLTAGLQVGL